METMNRILWMDLEMTGLDPEKEVIIEAAAIVTDMELKEIDEYHAVVQQPKSFLDNMDEWNTKTHTETGLAAKVLKGKPPSPS